MAYKDLREFIARLEKAGELKRISAEVDPVLEITEITHRVTRAGGPALLFERPEGSRSPLLINMLGSERRICLALEVDALDEVADRIRSLHRYASAARAARQDQNAAEARRAGRVLSKNGEVGPVQRSHPPRRFLAPRISNPAVLAAGCRPIHHLAAGVHAQSGDRQAQRRASIACRFSTNAPRACIGKRKSTAPNTSAAPAQPMPHGRIEVAVAIGADPVTCLPASCPFRPISTK